MRYVKRLIRFFPAVLLALALFAPEIAQACPSCNDVLAGIEKEAREAGRGSMAAGFNWSIVFMMAMPFLLAGTFAGVLYRSYRKSTAKPAGE